MSAVGAFTLVSVGVGINAATAVTKRKDPFPTLAAGVVLGTVCVAVDTATGTNLGTMLAALFLLTSFLSNGVSTVTMIERFINSKG